ncbi:hypothetical protein RP20_CCG005102 [Aedes albopictus]|nr:hypothetical protein RP20_CCG005102 [Aedes albopictus]
MMKRGQRRRIVEIDEKERDESSYSKDREVAHEGKAVLDKGRDACNIYSVIEGKNYLTEMRRKRVLPNQRNRLIGNWTF